MKGLNLSKKQKKQFARILISLAAFLVVIVVDKIVDLANVTNSKVGWLLPFCLYFAIYIAIGYDVLFKAVRNATHGQVLDENFLMAVATIGAFALGIYTGIAGKEVDYSGRQCFERGVYSIGGHGLQLGCGTACEFKSFFHRSLKRSFSST